MEGRCVMNRRSRNARSGYGGLRSKLISWVQSRAALRQGASIGIVLTLMAGGSASQKFAPQIVERQEAGEIVGVASVIDGDTLEIHGTRVRLHGIDAPESAQTCNLGARAQPCGRTAAFYLADLIGRRSVCCR